MTASRQGISPPGISLDQTPSICLLTTVLQLGSARILEADPAALGPFGSLSYLSQTLATTAGVAYSLFPRWLNDSDGAIPSEFLGVHGTDTPSLTR